MATGFKSQLLPLSFSTSWKKARFAVLVPLCIILAYCTFRKLGSLEAWHLKLPSSDISDGEHEYRGSTVKAVGGHAPLLGGHHSHQNDEGLYPNWKGDSLGEHVRVAKVSILYGDEKPVYERAIRTHETHNRLHGYPIYVLREPILDGYWTKPAYLLSLILRELAKPKSQRLSWLFWVDADTIIVNYKVPLEMFLPPDDDPELKDVHLLVAHDWNGLNNGVFPIRVSQWSAELLSSILSFRDFRPNTTLQFQDQSAMELMLQERKYAKHMVKVPQRWFNAYKPEDDGKIEPHQVRRGDLLVHFAGVGDRETLMTEWCERSEKYATQWVLDVEYTAYPAEVKGFWAGVKEERKILKETWLRGKTKLGVEIKNADEIIAVSAGRDNESVLALQSALTEGRKLLAEPGLEEPILQLEVDNLNLMIDQARKAYDTFLHPADESTPTSLPQDTSSLQLESTSDISDE